MGNSASNPEKKKTTKKNQRSRLNSIGTLNSVSNRSWLTVDTVHSNNKSLLKRLKKTKNIDPTIETTLDSQSTLFITPQVGSVYHSSITTTNSSLSNLADYYHSYSSEMVLKDLYMSAETSPERQKDSDRRHRQHYLLKRIWKSNYKIPLNNPTLIIDWCCATAVWDIELAFEFPNAKIVGIDYESATVSSLTNTVNNFHFQNAHIHEGDLGLDKFKDNQVDYIMLRDTWLVNSPSIKWKQLFENMYRILKPGGYIEIYEQDSTFISIGSNFNQLEQWSNRFYQAIQYDRSIVNELDNYLNQVGYKNIIHESIELPVGEWSDIKELKETGYLIKDLMERRFRENKRWYCLINQISEKHYNSILSQAIDECDQYKTSVRYLYYSAQKP